MAGKKKHGTKDQILLQSICEGIKDLENGIDTTSLEEAIVSSGGEVTTSVNELSELLQDLINALNDKVDYEYKSIGNPICYECPDSTKYQQVICNKYENGILVGTEVIIVGTEGILDSLPECAIPCSEILESYQVIRIDICFDDCTTGYNLIKINTATDTVATIGTFNIDGTPSTKAIVECPQLQVLEQKFCKE